MGRNSRSKIDPRIRGTAPRTRAKRMVPVFVEVADVASRQRLEGESWIKDFVHLVEGYCTLSVAERDLKRLEALPGVSEIEAVHYAQPLLEHSVDDIHGWDMPPRDRVNQGAGVVVGIIDYGLDFRLADFRNPGDRRTRVAYLWDQALKRKGKEQPPQKYGYGVEYTRAEIDAELRVPAKRKGAIVRHDPLHAEDNINGHGTHVAGIAAGNGLSSSTGYPPATYVGVAPAATLVFVNLARNTIVDHVDNPRGSLANSINLAHAIAYCFEKADELEMPCVVNLSMGFHGGGHDGDMIVEWIIDTLLAKAGRALVIAAGNEHSHHKQVYCGGRVKPGAEVELKWDIGRLASGGEGPDGEDEGHRFPLGDPTANEVEIWYSNECRLDVRLVAPGERPPNGWIRPDGRGELTFRGGEWAVVTSDQRTPWGDGARIHIRLIPGGSSNWIRYGTWSIQLRAAKVSPAEAEKGGVRYDAWIERTIPEPDPDEGAKELWSRFQDYDPDKAITLTTPATARRAIAVASCEMATPVQASDFSSRGPTRDGRRKPELAAPGNSIESSAAGASGGDPVRTQRWGTSMSAPHVTGVVARLLGRHNYLTADEIRDLLGRSATRPAASAEWDRERGYGKVNAAAAMKLLEQKLA